jgi:hypothetical protein
LLKKTERFALRYVEAADAARLSDLMTPDISAWLANWPVPFTPAMAAERIEAVLQAAGCGDAAPFVILSNDEVIGWMLAARKFARSSKYVRRDSGVSGSMRPRCKRIKLFNIKSDEIATVARYHNQVMGQSGGGDHSVIHMIPWMAVHQPRPEAENIGGHRDRPITRDYLVSPLLKFRRLYRIVGTGAFNPCLNFADRDGR